MRRKAMSLAPNLSVTFNQPMVALTGIGDLAKQAAPVKLSPSPKASGAGFAETLVFDLLQKDQASHQPLPAATRSPSEIPAGTTSANGGKLAQAVDLASPPLRRQLRTRTRRTGQRGATPRSSSPSTSASIPAVLKTITVKSGGKTFGLELVHADKLNSDEVLKTLAANAQEDRWLAFQATELLPADAAVNVAVGPGVPSAEGPLKSVRAESFSFRTYGPLKVVRSECGWGGECMPFSPWQIEFSNPLDRNTITDASVKIEPVLSSLTVEVYGNTMQIRTSQGRTTYRVTLDPTIGDIFGQTWAPPRPLHLSSGPPSRR